MKKFLIGFISFLVIVTAIGFFTPADYVVAKEITINAPPAAVHSYVGDLKKWPEWNPWEIDDESVVTTIGEPATGIGATQSWTSSSGDGELTFTKCDPVTGIAYDMAFIADGKRVPSSATVSYAKDGDSTVVSWRMEGSWKGAMPVVMDGWMKILSPLMIGGSFDDGLRYLKEKVEAAK